MGDDGAVDKVLVSLLSLLALAAVIVVGSIAIHQQHVTHPGGDNPCVKTGYTGYYTSDLSRVDPSHPGPGWVCTQSGTPVFDIPGSE